MYVSVVCHSSVTLELAYRKESDAFAKVPPSIKRICTLGVKVFGIHTFADSL